MLPQLDFTLTHPALVLVGELDQKPTAPLFDQPELHSFVQGLFELGIIGFPVSHAHDDIVGDP